MQKQEASENPMRASGWVFVASNCIEAAVAVKVGEHNEMH